MVAESVEDFLSNPKYASMINRRNNYSNGLKVYVLTQ